MGLMFSNSDSDSDYGPIKTSCKHKRVSTSFKDHSPSLPSTLEITFGDTCIVPKATSLVEASLPPCPGIPLIWPRADFFQSYPFQRHALNVPGFLGYRFCGIGDDGQSFVICSYTCCGTVSVPGDGACSECLALTDTVAHIAEMSGDIRAHTNYKYRSYQQLINVTDQLKGEIGRLRCTVRFMLFS